jgi:hypothetical protein
MLGDDPGLLKLLFDPNTLKLPGVHISRGARRLE